MHCRARGAVASTLLLSPEGRRAQTRESASSRMCLARAVGGCQDAETPSVAMLPHGMAPASSARAIAAAPTSPMLVSPSCRIARLRGGAAAAAVTAVATVALPAASAAAAPGTPGRSSRGLSSSAAASAAQPASAMGLEPSARRRRTERSPGWG